MAPPQSQSQTFSDSDALAVHYQRFSLRWQPSQGRCHEFANPQSSLDLRVRLSMSGVGQTIYYIPLRATT